MDSIRQMARDLLREYRRKHEGEQTPVMKALEEIDDKETAELFDNHLTQFDRITLKGWGVK